MKQKPKIINSENAAVLLVGQHIKGVRWRDDAGPRELVLEFKDVASDNYIELILFIRKITVETIT